MAMRLKSIIRKALFVMLLNIEIRLELMSVPK